MIKLSELEFDKAIDVMALLSIEINEVMQDKNLVARLTKEVVQVKAKQSQDEINALKWSTGIGRITSILPVLLKDHKHNIINVVAIMTEEDKETVKKMSLPQIIKVFNELLNDKDFLQLFNSIK